MEELISIIVPVYKVEKYLNRCIDSIIKQTHKNIEIILVDDGSPDKCGQICDEYAKKDKRIRVIHKQNGGLSDARNAGIEISTGKYLGFVDSDDFISPNMYEVLYKNLKNTNADISIGNFCRFSKEEEIVEDKKPEEIKEYNQKEMFEHMYDDYLFTVIACNKLYKKELFREIRYPVGKLIEDAAIIHYLIYESKKIVITNLSLYYYFQRSTSIMNTAKVGLLDELDFVYDRVKFFEKIGLQKEKFYNRTIEIYMDRLIELYVLFDKTKQNKNEMYKKYFIYMKELMDKYKGRNIKKRIKYALFMYLRPVLLFIKR